VNVADIRDLSSEELLEQIGQAKEELFRLRFRGATQELESPALIKALRRDIARMKTILRERELSHG
jgi:large subunit ribosomal protein L29